MLLQKPFFRAPRPKYFYEYAQETAQEVFNELDRELKPQVVFLEVLSRNLPKLHPIRIVPSSSGYKHSQFSDIRALINYYSANPSQRKKARKAIEPYPFNDPIMRKRYLEDQISTDLLRQIETIVATQDETERMISFCSESPLSLRASQYFCFMILRFHRDTFDKYHSLKKDSGEYFPRSLMPDSLLSAAIAEFEDWCWLASRVPIYEREVRPCNPDEMIRSAGRLLMRTPASSMYSPHGPSTYLFQAFNAISSLRYEGKEYVGTLLIVDRDQENIQIDVSLKEPVSLDNHRAVRKLIEMTTDDFLLFSDTSTIYGLGKQVGSYEPDATNLYRIDFKMHYTWELLHAGNALMRVSYGQPGLPRKKIDEEKFREVASRVFERFSSDSMERIWEITLEATKQKHGTMLVISNRAGEEAARLARQSTIIDAKKLTGEIVPSLTAIDGAVLIDPDCNCHAIGVILDGLASRRGDPSIGARYNSAVRYVETANMQSGHSCLAIVVSEDGSIDLVTSEDRAIRASGRKIMKRHRRNTK